LQEGIKLHSVYVIKNLLSGKVYVGCTNDVQQRKRAHVSDLNRKKHGSYRLQKDWDKQVKEDFEMITVECDIKTESEALNREQFWMDYYKSYEEGSGYNISPTAGTTLGRRHREESRRKMSESHSGKKLSVDHRRKQSTALKGYVKSKEHQDKITEATRERTADTYPRGERIGNAKLTENDVRNIKKLLSTVEPCSAIAKKFHVSYSAIYSIKTEKSWTHVKIGDPKEASA
jgi:group I intron endonuclease